MSGALLVRLREALVRSTGGAGDDLGTLTELGRPLAHDGSILRTAAWDPGVREAPGGVAWGPLEASAVSSWVVSVSVGSPLAWVVGAARPGPRGLLDRALLAPSRHVPAALEDVCTTLFVEGVGSLAVVELEARRNVVAVVGVRRA